MDDETQQPQGQETVESLAGRIKSKYPDYQSIDNSELVRRVTDKYPEYKSSLKSGEYERLSGKQQEAKPEESFFDKAVKGAALGAQHGAVSQAAVGAVKGLGHTGLTMADMGQKAVDYISGRDRAKEEGAYQTKKGGPILNANEEPSDFRKWLKPENLPQKVGFGAEQAAEFAVPGGAVSKAGKVAEGGIDALKAGPFLSKALKVLTRSGLEGVAGGGVAAAQGQDPVSAAGVSAAIPVAGAVLKPATKALADMAPGLANKALRPVPTQLEKAARFGRNPGQAVVDEGIIASSHGDLVNKIADRKHEVGQQIGDMLKAHSGKVIDARAAIEKPINDAVQDVVSGKLEGGQAMIDKLEELRHTLTSERRLVNGKLEVVGPKNLSLPPAETHALKRQIGDSTKWSDDQVTQAVNDVKRDIYGNLNEGVKKAVPSVAEHQDRYGNLLEAEKAAEREHARHQARNPFSLTDILSAMGAAGIAPGDFWHKALAGVGGAAANKAASSPLAKTAGAQALKNADWLRSPEVMRSVRNALLGARSANAQ